MTETELLRPGAASFCNRRIKINPLTNKVIEDVVFNRDIFNPERLVTAEKARKTVKAARDPEDGDGAARAARRARKQVFELCACNSFDLFFTLTLDPERIDRYDYKVSVRKFGQWADNQVRRCGLRYVAVPELHKDGAVHFHGLCNASAVRLVESGVAHRGHPIYNLPGWKLGFTTAMYLYGEPQAAAAYVAKYVTKQQGGGTIGGRYYYHGGDLQHARCVYLHADYNAAPGRELTVTDDVVDNAGDVIKAGLRCKYALV